MILVDYIFNHKRYKQVISLYKEACQKYNSAYKIWAKHHNLPDNVNYRTQKIVADNISEIRKVDAWIKTYANILRNKKEALLWLYNQKGKQYVRELKYNDYKFIIDNEKELNLLNNYMCTYNYLMQTQKEAVNRFLSSVTNIHSYNDIQKIALGKERITQITSILTNAHSCEYKYEYAWKCFSKGRNFNEIPICDLETVLDDKFNIKDTFLKLYEKKANLIKLILGAGMLPIDSFEKKTIEQEEELIQLLSSSLNPVDKFNADIHLENKDELKRAILDSKYYGNGFRFAESYDINKFYNLRNEFDNIGAYFDSAVEKVRENEAIVKAFNKEKSGKSVIFIEDYLSIVTEGSSLYIAVEQYNKEKEKRDKAKSIKLLNTKGFDAIYNCIDLDTCSMSTIIDIINNESQISIKNREIEEQERIKIEEEKKKREISTLYSCVENWGTLYCGLKYSYLINYYPTTCDFEATDSEWNDRWLVWNFKNTPGKTTPRHHQEALNNVVPRLTRLLQNTFGLYLPKLTLVCIPASSAENTYARFHDFSELLCSQTSMENSFDRISVLASKVERRNGGTSINTNNLQFDNEFFRGRYIILFDDVITRGDSMSSFKEKMQQLGSIVIAGISIGKTKHLRDF